MSEALEVRVRQVAADVFDLPLAQVTEESTPQSIDGWDSVQHLNLVLALEQELGIRIDPEDIERMLSIAEVIQLVRDKISAP